MPNGPLDLSLEEYLPKLRETSLATLRKKQIQDRAALGSRLSDLDRLRSPSREILLGPQTESEDMALSQLLADLAGREFDARLGLEQLQFQREESGRLRSIAE